jgi:nitrate/TMAO reductase-like tetraheme cytochrome c subunit
MRKAEANRVRARAGFGATEDDALLPHEARKLAKLKAKAAAKAEAKAARRQAKTDKAKEGTRMKM